MGPRNALLDDLEQLFVRQTIHAVDQHVPRHADLDFVLDAGAAHLVRQNRAVVHRPDARLHLPHVACPVLVVCGAADQLTPPECSAEIAALVPAAEHHLLPDSGHMLTMEQPDAVNHLLVQWLARSGWI